MTISSLAIYVLAFMFVLGVLIFIHELGHFLVARFFGIGVHVFSLGFGKRLVGFRRGDTDYRLSMIPLGGYVKMAGENPDEELTGSPEEFLSRPKMERFWVAVAGPVMNLALAVVLLATTFMIGQEVLEYLEPPSHRRGRGSRLPGPAGRPSSRRHDRFGGRKEDTHLEGSRVPHRY